MTKMATERAQALLEKAANDNTVHPVGLWKHQRDAIAALFEKLDHEVAERKRLEGIIDAHELCHDQHGKVGAEEFAASCANEQRKLFGCAPHADRIEWLEHLLSLARDECVTCGVESCRHEGADHEFYQPTDLVARLEAENAELRKARDEAHTAIHRMLLGLPKSRFATEMDDWLASELDKARISDIKLAERQGNQGGA